MKNLFPSRVIVCVITLLTLTFPVFAQTTNATDEYEETYSQLGEIKKEISMRRKALNEFAEYLKREKCIHS